MRKSRRFVLAVLVASAFCNLSPSNGCCAVPLSFHQFALEMGYGAGIENTILVRLDFKWRLLPRLAGGKRLELVGFGQLSGGLWRGDRDIWNLSATPILRLQRPSLSHRLNPYLEAGIGLHYISEIQMRRRVLSTNFQFGDHLGLGIQIGRSRTTDICYIFQHHSNASIKRPNSGVNFHIIRIGYSF